MLLFVIGNRVSFGQKLIGNSAYSGTDGVILNPAFVGGTPYRVFIKLFSEQVGLDNNYAKLNASIYSSHLVFDQTTLQTNNNGKPKMANINADFRLPSFMFKVNSKINIGVISRVRGGIQANNISEIIAKQLVNNTDPDQFLGTLNQNTNLNLNVNAFSEIGITYGQTILESDNHVIRGGISLKRLVGVYSGHINSQDLSFTLNKEFTKSSEQTVANIQHINLNYGYTNWTDEHKNFSNWITGQGMPGRGLGIDLGLSYEYRKSIDEDYLYKIGFAIVDMGRLKYKSDNNVFNYSIERMNKKLTIDDVSKAISNSADSVVQVFNNVLDVKPAEKSTTFKSGLPTALNITFDYKLAKKLYVNATLVQNMRKKTAIAMRQYSMLAITPRAQMKGFEFSLPLILVNNYKNFALGASMRLGPFYFGSENIAGLIGIGKPYGLDAYFGMRFGLFKSTKVEAAE